MWKVILVMCTLGNPCVIMHEDPMAHYKNYNDCMAVAKEKHKLISESFAMYGYQVERSEYKCEQDPNAL